MIYGALDIIFLLIQEAKRDPSHVTTETGKSKTEYDKEMTDTMEEMKNKQNEGNIQDWSEEDKEEVEQEQNMKIEDNNENSNLNVEIGDNEDEEQECVHEDEDEEDNDDGWITPSNISKVKKEMGLEEIDESAAGAKSACLTTDFAMQVIEFCPIFYELVNTRFFINAYK